MEFSENPEERGFAISKGKELDDEARGADPDISKPTERTREKPVWNRDSLTLTIGGVAFRRFRRAKANEQLRILDAFQEQEWPEAINDPFKDEFKLRETVKSFNRVSKNAANSDKVFRIIPGRTRIGWYFGRPSDVRPNVPSKFPVTPRSSPRLIP